MKLNLGCGSQLPSGWTNVDYALGARIARIPLFRALNKKIRLFRMDWDDAIVLHDLTRTFPWPDNSVDVVYSSHTLEHMSREQGRAFLAECHRVLKPGGIIRIVVPDLSSIVRNYLDGNLQAEDFVDTLGVLYLDAGGRWKNRLAPFVQYPHKCMYDTPALVRCLTNVGFDARGRSPFDSTISGIADIEIQDRTVDAVIVEGVKNNLGKGCCGATV